MVFVGAVGAGFVCANAKVDIAAALATPINTDLFMMTLLIYQLLTSINVDFAIIVPYFLLN
jgi:hypothetical protein